MTRPSTLTAVGTVDEPNRRSSPETASSAQKHTTIPTTTAFWTGRVSARGPAFIRRWTVAGSTLPRYIVGASDTTTNTPRNAHPCQ